MEIKADCCIIDLMTQNVALERILNKDDYLYTSFALGKKQYVLQEMCTTNTVILFFIILNCGELLQN